MKMKIKQAIWKKEAEELADNLELYYGSRSCLICGCEPEKQQKMISQELKRERKATINKVKEWTKGRQVTKESLRQFLNYLKEGEK